MPRPVKIRADYRNDAGFLLRLESAVLKDDRQSVEWRQLTATMIRQLAIRFLEADSARDQRKPSSVRPKPTSALASAGGK